MAKKGIESFVTLESESSREFRVVRTTEEIHTALEEDALFAVVHFEGAEPIAPPLESLQHFYEEGLRSIGIVWSRKNAFGYGVHCEFPGSPDMGPGLTDAGKELVPACNRLGIMLDLSHLNEKGFWDVEKMSEAPLVATHSCVHAVCPSPRNLTDKQLPDAIDAVQINLSDRMPPMKIICALVVAGSLFLHLGSFAAAEVKVSDATQACIECHRVVHPGIVEDWQRSRHAAVSPKEAMAVKGLGLKVSSPSVPGELQGVAVGCAECHTLRPKEHADAFEHNGYDIHIVVSPGDCRTCHAQEAEQYSRNIMAHGYKNLAGNKLYNDLEHTLLGGIQRKQVVQRLQPPEPEGEVPAFQ